MTDIENMLENSERGKKAASLFREGYNCTQAVCLAFEDLCGLDRETLLKLSSSFGGGMGRLREVCGTVSGMFLVAGILYGYSEPKDFEGKKTHYERIQELARRFEEINGSIICRVLLGLDHNRDCAVSEKRTEEYYKKRPCATLAGIAAAILEEYIEKESRNE